MSYILATAMAQARQELGSTTREVAATLYRGGFFGERRNPDGCPLQNYFHQRLGQPVFVGKTITVRSQGARDAFKRTEAEAEFVSLFDQKRYRFLEKGRRGQLYRYLYRQRLQEECDRDLHRRQAWSAVRHLGEWQNPLPDINNVTYEPTPDSILGLNAAST